VKRIRGGASGGSYDVVVVGGGAGGVGAAVGAARCGAHTLLIERRAYLGGAATASSVLSYCGFYTQGDQPVQVVHGVGAEVLNWLGRHGLDTTPHHTRTGNTVIVLDPELTKRALDDVVLDAGVDLLLHCDVAGVEMSRGHVETVKCVEDGGVFEVTAKGFVDATGNANLVGLASNAARGLSVDERQRGSLVLRIGGLPPDAPTPTLAELVGAVAAANTRRRSPLREPHGFLGRLPVSGDLLAIISDVDVDPLSARSLTVAEVNGRAEANDYLEAFREGVPALGNAYMVSTGPEIGVRQARAIQTVRPVTGPDARRGGAVPDLIAQAGWPMEFHDPDGSVRYEPIGGPGWFGVPYGALLPIDLDNVLLAGRTIGADAEAYASVRVMGTSFATGQAAGIGAAVLASRGSHDVPTVQAHLQQQEAALSQIPEPMKKKTYGRNSSHHSVHHLTRSQK